MALTHRFSSCPRREALQIITFPMPRESHSVLSMCSSWQHLSPNILEGESQAHSGKMKELEPASRKETLVMEGGSQWDAEMPQGRRDWARHWEKRRTNDKYWDYLAMEETGRKGEYAGWLRPNWGPGMEWRLSDIMKRRWGWGRPRGSLWDLQKSIFQPSVAYWSFPHLGTNLKPSSSLEKVALEFTLIYAIDQ